MLRFVIKKMRHNKWLFLCLIVAAIIVNALICSISIYSRSNAINILCKNLDEIITKQEKFPGTVDITCAVGLHLNDKDPLVEFNDFKEQIVTPFKEQTRMPLISESLVVDTKNSFVLRYDERGMIQLADSVSMIKDVEDHIHIIGGRGFSNEKRVVHTNFKAAPEVEVVEMLLEKNVYSGMGVAIGDQIYLLDQYGHENWIADDNFEEDSFYVAEVVGVFEKVDDESLFWQTSDGRERSGILLSYDVAMDRIFKEHPWWFNNASWHLHYDYSALDMPAAKSALETIIDTEKKFETSFINKAEVTAVYRKPVEACFEDIEKLTRDIFLFLIPVLFMLGLFIFMITQFIVSSDQNEIATLRSRGATKVNIFLIYLFESMLISGIAILIGPFVGVGLCKIIGSSNGFLSFVGRKLLKTQINIETYVYAIGAQLLFIINMLIPVLLYANVNVVEHSKRNVVQKRSLWKLLGIDFIALGLSIYFILKYYKKVKRLLSAEMVITDIGIDPILYLISTLLILGLALFFLRIYPLFIRLMSFIGRRFLSVTFYAGLKNVGRVEGNELFIMLFMIMAIGIGVLNANEARSYNEHNEEAIKYDIGAEVVVMPHWRDFHELPKIFSRGPDVVEPVIRPDYWIEPDIELYRNLKGAKEMCKVARKAPYASYIDDKMVHNDVQMVAIEPYQFGKVAWYKDGLLPTHLINYLNIMLQNKQAIFVTTNAQKEREMEIGQSVELVINDSKNIEAGRITGIVCGFVDYWPGVQTKNEEGEDVVSFIVDYRYVENIIGTIPYELWFRLDDTASEKTFLDDLSATKDIEYDEIAFQKTEVLNMQNDAYNKGINGTLTLGFMIIMIITMIGFMIYWLLALKQRSLQFGIMRAMGVSKGSIYGMLLIEQILLFGSAIIVGVLIGSFTSELVVPLLQLLGRKVTDTYPAVVNFKRSDYLKIYGVTMIMLGSSMLMIFRMMRKIKVAEILKLGEER